jgi:hypothetical protein
MPTENTSELRQRGLNLGRLLDAKGSIASVRCDDAEKKSTFLGWLSQYIRMMFQLAIGQLLLHFGNTEPIVSSSKEDVEINVKNKNGNRHFVDSLARIHQISVLHPEYIQGQKVSTEEVEQQARSAFRFKERLRKRAYSQMSVPAKSRIREGTFELLSSPPESQCTLVALGMHAVSIVCLGHTLIKQMTVISETRDSPFIETRLEFFPAQSLSSLNIQSTH